MKFYGKEYDEIKHIPIRRLWGYFDYMAEYNKPPEERLKEDKIRKAKDKDWDKEVKEAKRELWLKKE